MIPYEFAPRMQVCSCLKLSSAEVAESVCTVPMVGFIREKILVRINPNTQTGKTPYGK